MKIPSFLSAAAMAVVVAVVESASTSAPGAEDIDTRNVLGKSAVSSLLVATGFSEACVAEALDTCAPASMQLPLPPNPLGQEARQLLQEVRQVVNHHDNRPRHCKDLLDGGDSGKGLRHVYPFPGQHHRRVAVYCDHTTDGGGWTVFQRRTNLSIREDFNRSWVEYQLGFGKLEGEFWLGLDLIHQLTSEVLQELRINMAAWDGGQAFAKYGYFYIGPSSDKYRINLGRYSGNAGDSLERHTLGQRFSTYDADNDELSGNNCVLQHGGPWWYKSCSYSNLNGFQYEGNIVNRYKGINWESWRGEYYSLRETVMMIRPAF